MLVLIKIIHGLRKTRVNESAKILEWPAISPFLRLPTVGCLLGFDRFQHTAAAIWPHLLLSPPQDWFDRLAIFHIFQGLMTLIQIVVRDQFVKRKQAFSLPFDQERNHLMTLVSDK